MTHYQIIGEEEGIHYMDIAIRSMRNVLRNPLRLILVVLLLGVSLMFVAAMFSLNGSAQQQIANVHKEVGTAITINYATNEAGGYQQNGGATGAGGARGAFGSGATGAGGTTGGGAARRFIFGNQNTTPIPNSVITTVQKVSGIASVEESLVQEDTDGTLKTSTFQTPNGQSISIPPSVNGISSGATHFTLQGGATPTIVSGTGFQSNQGNANVAMMSQTLATNNNLKVGSTFKLKGTTLTIVGLYTTTGQSQFSSNTIILPLATTQRIFNVDGVDSITAYVSNSSQEESIATKLRSVLGSKFDVVTSEEQYTSTFDALNVAQNSIRLALIVAIATAAVVIIFAVFILVRERITEIGTLKAIGASHWQVIRQFWSEVLTLSGLSAILAAILLVALGPIISQKFDVSSATPTANAAGGFARAAGAGGFGGGAGGFGGGAGGFGGGARATLFAARASQASNVHLTAATLNAETLLIILGLGIGLAIISSLIPSWYVARIKPAEVLRRGN
jgi:putative ABC transport system permease protein